MLEKPRCRTTLLPILLLLLLCSPRLLHFAVRNAKANTMAPVRNVDTGLSYVSIQAAIDAPETADGHTLLVDPGMYLEHVEVYKSLKIVGSSAETTIIDGGSFGTIVHINTSNVFFSGFTVRNGGNSSVDFLNSGIFIDYCENVTLSNNIVANCRYGVYLFHSAYNRLMDNNVSMNYEDGVWLYYSGNNILERNTIAGNKYNFGVFGQSFADFNNTIDMSNVVDDKPIRYEIGLSDKVFDSRTKAGTLYLINADNVTVRDLHLSGNGNGVFLWNSTDSRIENVTASENNYGIFLKESDGNVVSGSNCPNNWVGIFLEDADRNIVKGNSAPANEKGISLYGSSENSLEGNTVSGNLYGIRFFASSSNEICHNNVVENTEPMDLVNSHRNDLDNGAEGNFWSDYAGSDVDEDGIGDTPHYVRGEQDRYPLMGEYREFEVSRGHEVFSIPLVSSSLIISFRYGETGDEGVGALSFNITSQAEKVEFCRVSIPTALLSGPFTIKVDDSLESNTTLRDLSSTNSENTLLYFSYNSTMHTIAIVGTATNSTLFFEPYMILALFLGVLFACIFAFYVVEKRRARRDASASDTRTG